MMKLNLIEFIQSQFQYLELKSMNICCLLLLILVGGSCDKKSDTIHSSDAIVYIKGAENLQEHIIEPWNEGTSLTLTFAGAYTEIEDMLKAAPADIDLHFKIDLSLVEEYNTKSGTNYAPLPINNVSIAVSASKIEKGTKETPELSAMVDLSSGLDPFTEYLLPISIDQVNDGFKIDKRKGTIYYKISVMDNAPVQIKVGLLTNTSGNMDMTKVANIANPENPDVLVVCEMDKNTTRSGGRDMSEILKDLLNIKHYRFVKGQDLQGGEFGLTIYSRFPIKNFTPYILTGSDTRPFGIAELDVNGQTFVIAGIHLTHVLDNQVNQVNQALSHLSGVSYPLFLAGHLQENRDPHQATTIYPVLTNSGFVLPCSTCARTYNSNPTIPTQGGWTYGMLYRPESRFEVKDYKVLVLPAGGLTLHHPIFATLDVYFYGDKN